jgi:hypothetical protein
MPDSLRVKQCIILGGARSLKLVPVVIKKSLKEGRIFWPFVGNTSRKRFLQDRVLDCQIEPQRNFCSKGQEAVTRQLSSGCMSDTVTRYFGSSIGFWDLLKWLKISPMIVF